MSDFDKCPICTNFRSVFRKNFGTSVIYVKNCISGELDTITEKNEKLSEHSLISASILEFADFCDDVVNEILSLQMFGSVMDDP